MKILKHGIMAEPWPAIAQACPNCKAEVELEKDDLWRGWSGSMDDGKSVAKWSCPECRWVNQFDMEWDRLKLLPDRSEWKAPA